MTNPATSQMRDLAERLFADEEAAATSSPPGVTVSFRVCEKLRRPLTTLAGSAGFQSLLTRALALAKRDAPGLGAVQVNADGSLANCDELKLDTRDAEGEVLLIAHLLGLLFTFIGATLTLRLMQDVWPDVSFNYSTSEGDRKP
jgi:hypothetical protein